MEKVPQEFVRFTSSLYSGAVEWPPNGDDWLVRQIEQLSARQKSVIKAYLNRLLATDVSDQQLQEIWMSGGPGYGVGRQQYRGFFAFLKSKFSE
jgi:hypothetical protein